MSEELNKKPDAATENIETPVETAAEEKAPVPARKNDPWKTAFIVLAGISVISAGIFYAVYARKNDLPTVPAAADPYAQPVQMANPPTGISEQTALAQPLPQVVGNAADMGVPGAGGFDPWANPGRFQQSNSATGPYQVYPSGPPGQQMYMDVNPNSPFMQDGNTYVMVPANSNAAVNANKNLPQNSANRAKPATSPSPGTVPPAANTPVPTVQPKTDPAPANKPVKPIKKPPTGKPSGTSNGKKAGSDTEQDT